MGISLRTFIEPLSRMAKLARQAVQRVGFGRPSGARVANDGDGVRDAVMGGARRHFLLAGLFSAAINLLYLAPSLYMLQVYDRVLVSGGLLTLVLLSVVALVALLLLAVLDGLRSRVVARLALQLDGRLAQRVTLLNFQARARGDGVDQSGVRDLDNLRQGISSPGVVALMDVPWTPLFVLACFAVHPAVGFLATFGALLIFAVALLNERSSRGSIEAVTTAAPGFYGGIEADLRMAEVARSMGMAERLIARRMGARRALVGAQTEAAFVGAHYAAAAKFVRLVLQSATLGLGAYLAVAQQISAGAIIAATVLAARAFAPIEQVVGSWRQTRQTFSAYRSLQKLMTEEATQTPRTRLPAAKGQIDVEGVIVRHGGAARPALAGVSLSTAPGAIVGVVGPSGAGKSTLARILANAASPTAGAVRLDKARYEDWPPDDLAGAIGYLPQSIDLPPGTIAQNISRFEANAGRPADDVSGRVVAAAKAAGAHELILRLQGGYETPIGAGGVGLSHGQMQRIGIARALYGEPALIVLDEPNAHLDDDGETQLIAALVAARARGATVFVVAHRTRLLGIADFLVVLREGFLLEYGPREKVMAKMAAASGAAQLPSVVKLQTP